MNDEPEGASQIFAALVMVGLLVLVMFIARDNCWIQTPELPRLVPSLGSPTPIDTVKRRRASDLEDDSPTIPPSA